MKILFFNLLFGQKRMSTTSTVLLQQTKYLVGTFSNLFFVGKQQMLMIDTYIPFFFYFVRNEINLIKFIETYYLRYLQNS